MLFVVIHENIKFTRNDIQLHNITFMVLSLIPNPTWIFMSWLIVWEFNGCHVTVTIQTLSSDLTMLLGSCHGDLGL